MSAIADIFDADGTIAVTRIPSENRNAFRFTVPGEPVPKGRPRVGRLANGRPIAFTPQKTRTYEAEIRAIAAEHWGDRALLADVGIFVIVDAYRAVPKSFSRKATELALAGQLRPRVKPDADNFGKSATDALNAVVFRDDALIVDLHVRKWYAANPRLEIEVRWT